MDFFLYMQYNITFFGGDCIKFWFELVSQIMFEIKIEKMAHLTYFSSSICKWLFVKILIYCILMVITLKNIHLWYDNYQTFHMAHK